jgi:hypothetical protein
MPSYVNHFDTAEYREETIKNDAGIVGTIRIKPSGVLWKPVNAREFFSVSLEKFAAWMSDPSTDAKKTSK